MSTARRKKIVDRLDTANRTSVMVTVMFIHSIASLAGINPVDLQCLHLLTLEGPMTPSRLAEAVVISKGGAVTAMIDRLEKAGYVRRVRHPKDRRQVLIEVIVDGEPMRKLETYFDPVGEAFAGILTDYTDEQLELITEFILRSNEMVRRFQFTT